MAQDCPILLDRFFEKIKVCISQRSILVSYALRHFLTLSDLTALQISTLLSEALYLEERWKKRDMPDALAGRRVALIVDDDGWRNTFAFDLGIQAMGGCCAHGQIKLGTREETADLARYLSNWVDAVVIRTKSFEQLRELADATTVPVINARTKANHPCETLGDLCFVKAQRGSIEGLKVVAVAPDANIIRSWVEAAAVLPISVTQIYPEK